MYKYLVRINTPEELEVFAKHYNRKSDDLRRDIPRLYYISTNEKIVGSDGLFWEGSPQFSGAGLPIYSFKEWLKLVLEPEAATKLTQQTKLQLVNFPRIKWVE